jgi:hypothetical protein
VDSKNINRLWMIKKLKFFRFLFHLFILCSLVSFTFFGIIPVLLSLGLSALFYALADMVRLDLDYPPT